jgi:hypothetical protein
MNNQGSTPVTTRLGHAFAAFVEAATKVAEAPVAANPPDGEWNADQIVAHVSILTATTLRAAAAISSGEHTTYDNRISHEEWTLGHVLRAAGGSAALLERVRVQAEALCGYATALGQADLETLLPTRLISHGAVLVDQPLALGVLLDGFADNEIPGHTSQLLALS